VREATELPGSHIPNDHPIQTSLDMSGAYLLSALAVVELASLIAGYRYSRALHRKLADVILAIRSSAVSDEKRGDTDSARERDKRRTYH
jgi:hypothetical protein